MRKEAQRRGEVVRDLILAGYNVRVEIYEKSVEDPEKPPGDAYKLKQFVIDQFSDVGEIENEKIRKTHGVNLVSQMAFDVRLKPTETIDDGYNAQTMQKLLEWTEKRSDIATLELNKSDVIKSDIEIHENDEEDDEIIDYIDEELENTIGYFKEWDNTQNNKQ